MQTTHQPGRVSRACYRVIYAIVKLVYPTTQIDGLDCLPDGGCLVVGNHTQMNGPIIGEIYFPGPHAIWCAGQMMHLRDVPAYAYQDFWSRKPKAVRWLYRLAAYAIAPLAVCVFNNAHTIPVYHDTRLLTTFRQTLAALAQGQRVIIFPECYTPYNHIVNEFQDKFVDVARMHHKRTGQALAFVPMYNAPMLRRSVLGRPIVFDPAAPIEQERERICTCLKNEITALAMQLPPHKVVPYDNVSRRHYRDSIPGGNA